MCFDVWPESGQPTRLASIEAAAATSLASPCTSTAIVFTSAYKMNRFFVVDGHADDPDVLNLPENEDRDVLNERPYHDALNLSSAVNEAKASSNAAATRTKRASQAVIHTTLGDIAVVLYHEQCPKTIENFCGLASAGYYDGHVFHRVIRQFMIQTGDPLGTGVGGQSVWGSDFDDEFHPSLKHDKPYTLSMANIGPNTNGSQFFITVVPCPWLDNKHTLFGRCVKGMDVIHAINNLKTDKNDKPEEDVKIVSVTLRE